ncbi:hypothetical protein B0H11DRAFT_2152709 [Mycena galericulata]|nr:hypothetical protein B0H11DRAFT_2152709 [Mycena galericulata]
MSASAQVAPRRQKDEGDISAVFTSLRPSDPKNAFPPRFSELKREIWKEGLIQSWKEVLSDLEVETKRIAELGETAIPRISMESIRKGLTAEEISTIRTAGCVVAKGAIPKDKYVALNPGKVKGAFPADNIQVFKLYNTVSQIRARTHLGVLESQRALLSLWHDPSGNVNLDTPISYFDRLRIRFPGDAKFALGPHDPAYCKCFSKILEGGSAWKQSQCSIFRPWQGWTSISSTGPGEGTLRVLPMLSLATAYWILRPFFRARDPTSASLRWEDWDELELDGTAFAGSGFGTGMELNEASHPHLRLDKTMISMPKVEPGNQVYWNCDMIHAVEGYHVGTEDSSVMYIPAVPLTLKNAQYLRDQRSNF